MDSPRRAEQLLGKLNRQISRLAQFPSLGHAPKDQRLKNRGYRVLVVEDYLVFYVRKEKTVQIRRVIHGARRYAFLL